MAAGSPITMSNAHDAISTTQPGPITQMALIAGLTTTATSGTLPTANGTVTIADATTPTVVELLEYCVELETKVEALLTALQTASAMASS